MFRCPCSKTFNGRNLRMIVNKLECLSLASLCNLVYCLRVRPGAYARVVHVKVTSLKDRLLYLFTNVRLRLKGMPTTNTLAYYEHSDIYDVKILITLGPSVDAVNYGRNLRMFVIS